MINYEDKYLKYKSKYLNYKLKGGASLQQLGLVLMMRQLIIKRLYDFQLIDNKSIELQSLITRYKYILSHLNKAVHSEESIYRKDGTANRYFDLNFNYNLNLQCVLNHTLEELRKNVRARKKLKTRYNRLILA